MYVLPYFKINKELLIPHPGNSYTLTIDLKKLSEGFTIPTKTLTLKNETINDCFIIGLSFDKDVTSQYAALAVLDSVDTFDDLIVSFTVINKVLIKEVLPNDEASFHLLKPAKSISSNHKQQIEILIAYLKNSDKYKKEMLNVDLANKKDPYLLDKIFAFLCPDLIRDYRFFDTEELEQKLNIIYSLIIEVDTLYSEIKSIKKPIVPNYYPQYVAKVIKKEEDRIARMAPNVAEYSSTLDYIDCIKSLPWQKTKEVKLSIAHIKSEFEATHHGLPQVKDHIIEFFALEELTGHKAGSALLLDGPPGTGKTTIAKSIAKATGRDFIRIALGGVSDEAEIRGHRRTYIGSKPGRIISAFQKIESSNPVILLDELDKVAALKGDPFSALLELLDPEQNYEFTDRYLEVPFDVSKCLFICTSNNKDNIPNPLLDRLEIINFRDYTEDEKLYIINNHIIPNILNEYNLIKYNISFDQELLKYLANKYNLRDINKVISRLLRNEALLMLNNQKRDSIKLLDYDKLFICNKPLTSTRRIGFAR